MYRKNSKEDVVKGKEKCMKILSISPKIRYVGIINNYGRTIVGILRTGVIPLLKTDDAIKEHFIEATRNQIRRSLDPILGKTIFTITENEKVIMLTIPFEEGFYYITFDKDTDISEIKNLIHHITDEA